MSMIITNISFELFKMFYLLLKHSNNSRPLDSAREKRDKILKNDFHKAIIKERLP